MPIFKMKCRRCGKVFEALFKTSSSTARCPECDSDILEKLPSEIAVAKNNSADCPAGSFCPNASPCCCNGKCGGHR